MDNSRQKCKATKKNGEQCNNYPIKKYNYCYPHSFGKFKGIPFYKNPTIHLIVGILSILVTIILFNIGPTRKNQEKMIQNDQITHASQENILKKIKELDEHYMSMLENNINPNSRKEILQEKAKYQATLEILEKELARKKQKDFIDNWPLYIEGRKSHDINFIITTVLFPSTHFLNGTEKYFVYQLILQGGVAEHHDFINKIDTEFRNVGYSAGTTALPIFHRLGQMGIIKRMPIEKIIFEEPYLNRVRIRPQFKNNNNFYEYVFNDYRRILRENISN